MPSRSSAQRRRERAASRAAADALLPVVQAETDPEQLAQYARHSWSHVRTAAAKNTRTPEPEMVRLARDPHPGVRAAVLENPAAPVAALIAGVRNPKADPFHLDRLALRRGLPEQVYRELRTRRMVGVLIRLGHNPDCPADLLSSLAGSSSLDISAAALANPNLPRLETRLRRMRIARLAKVYAPLPYFMYRQDEASRVLPEAIHEVMLARIEELDEEEHQAYAIASSTRATPALLAALSTHPYPRVQAAVARNVLTAPETLTALCMAPDLVVRQAASNNPCCPEEGRVAAAVLGMAGVPATR